MTVDRSVIEHATPDVVDGDRCSVLEGEAERGDDRCTS